MNNNKSKDLKSIILTILSVVIYNEREVISIYED